MASQPEILTAAGVSVRFEGSPTIAALRSFDSASAFETELADLLGGRLPEPLRAERRSLRNDRSSGAATEFVLAWRSPTESLLMSDAAHVAAIARRVSARVDGCLVDQTGGISALTITGARSSDLLTRLGSPAAIPLLGEARTSRLAELPVMSLCLRAGEFTLLVERVYRPHLAGWIRETLADFERIGCTGLNTGTKR